MNNRKKSVYEQIKEALAVASQAVIVAPIKLPPVVVLTAKYLALALGVLEAIEGAAKANRDAAEDEEAD